MINFLAVEDDHILNNNRFPLSSKYNPEWIFKNEMGPNVLWLLEWLLEDLKIENGMRILDMGCGKVVSSIFLANEFDVEVWANDLWISATDNWNRICEAGKSKKIFPIHAEAHDLPYPDNFFDCIVSIDSYHYYGTDELYAGYIKKYLKPGGKIGIVVPGVHNELNGNIPEYFLKKQKSGGVFWEWDCCTFHTENWWKAHWQNYPFFNLIKSEKMEDGGHLWLTWQKALDQYDGNKEFPSDSEALEQDDNRTVTFVKVIAEKKKHNNRFFY